jgi:hypothetical protein
MWLMTKHGFFSIVEKKPGEFHVRARECVDLENLAGRVPLEAATIVSSPEADYAFRIILGRPEVLAIMRFLGETVDYPNFKDEIDRTADQQNKPYHEVWDTMADSLGAYGATPIQRDTDECI